MIHLQDRVCVVTGAAKSIGFGIAASYAEAGAKVALIDINQDVVQSAEQLKDRGFTAQAYVIDITDEQQVAECFDAIASTFGPVFALVNNAGVVSQCPFDEVTTAEMDKIFKVNVYGTVYCTQAALKTMKQLGDGRIINFSSKSGKTGSALMAPYSAAKGAIISLTHALAFEYAGANIKVNCICPGITDDTGVWANVSEGYTKNLNLPKEEVVKKFTAKIPLGRLTRIEDVVELVQFITTSGDYCTGQAFNITGGREVH
ncbi:MAG: SDR family oxidoreductase [Sphaerochaeta sp.]|jgi:NAD(P)-dependent dehydrogenase (short-subunit alcohol dehydrogenase family)|nr:SDR family oxidoreductase [Sphaerochaeta sp.]MDX9914522.1 SDR family oxidoreductase [Sphaerochaeta sp.]